MALLVLLAAAAGAGVVAADLGLGAADRLDLVAQAHGLVGEFDHGVDQRVEFGVEGTPTFFLNGDKVEVSSFAELVALIDAALAA